MPQGTRQGRHVLPTSGFVGAKAPPRIQGHSVVTPHFVPVDSQAPFGLADLLGLLCSEIFEQNKLNCQALTLSQCFLNFGNHFILIFFA